MKRGGAGCVYPAPLVSVYVEAVKVVEVGAPIAATKHQHLHANKQTDKRSSDTKSARLMTMLWGKTGSLYALASSSREEC